MTPAIFGLAGPVLTADERAFFADADPAGYILFGRNIEDREQLRALTDSLRAIQGRERLLITIDQEGGPVARLKPPLWPRYPAGSAFDKLYEIAPASAIEAAGWTSPRPASPAPTPPCSTCASPMATR
jgi:beta-N-acetylhexosaminidase